MTDAITPRPKTGLANIDVAILAGGLGTRIRDVLGDTPKVLAPINGRAFLDHVLDRIAAAGGRRVVLCLGHAADRVIAHLEESPRDDLVIETAIEPEPLGTAWALRFARPMLQSDPVMVMNGDTYLDADLSAFATDHRASGAAASLICVAVDSVARYGRVDVRPDGLIARFVEKDATDDGPGVVSGGVYLFSGELLDRLASGRGVSLERDFLEQLPPGSVRAWIAEGATFVDIGTPASLRQAATLLPKAGPTGRRVGAA